MKIWRELKTESGNDRVTQKTTIQMNEVDEITVEKIQMKLKENGV